MNPPDRPAALKVFLVEESLLLRQRIAAMLCTLEGVEMAGMAEEPETAVAGVTATHADVVIVDVRLTGASGLDVVAGMARRAWPVVIIVLTQHSSAPFRRACFAAGAHYFFDKTTEYEAARATIQSLARSHRLARARPDAMA
jgi:DNA-binding NarL/FixJ family response regulator